MPIAAKVIIVIVVLGIIGAALGDPGGEQVEAASVTTSATQTTATTPPETTTTVPTTTTTPPETTTTIPATTTTTRAPSTTTEVTLSLEDQQLIFKLIFDDQASEIAAVIEDGIFHIESVDELYYEDGVVVFAATSAFPTLLPEDLADDGWDIMQAWKAYFTAILDSGDGVDANIIPGIQVTLSGHRFECPASFMLDMVSVRASQEDFINECFG